MSTRGYVLRNVLCNDNRGELLAIGYKYSDEKEKELNSRNRGLVLFFRGENDLEWKYVKSFILTPKERLGLVNPDNQSTIVRDIGYLLSFPSPVTLEVFNLASYSTGTEERDLFKVSKVGVASFYIDLEVGNRRAKYERACKANVMYGFNLLIYKALAYDNEVDCLCSSYVPEDVILNQVV